MTFPEFVNAVDNLVREWNTDEGSGRFVPRDALQAIWESTREQAVYDLAEMTRQRDEAMKQLHRRYLEEGIKLGRPPKGKLKHDRPEPTDRTADQGADAASQ